MEGTCIEVTGYLKIELERFRREPYNDPILSLLTSTFIAAVRIGFSIIISYKCHQRLDSSFYYIDI